MVNALVRDRLLAAASWWFGLVGLIGAFVNFNPPMHPRARRHCFAGFVFNAGLVLLNLLIRLMLPADAADAFMTIICCVGTPVVLVNTAAAAMGSDVFFWDVIFSPTKS